MTIHLVPLSEVVADAVPGFASGDRSERGIPQVRMNCVDTEGALDLTVAPRVPAVARIDRYLLEPGDVVFNATSSRELVGKCALFTGWPEPVTFSNHFQRIRTRRELLEPAYLARWLTWQQRRGAFAAICARWVNQAVVRNERLLALRIPLPSLAEQRLIAAVLDKADAIRRKRRESLRLLDEFLRSVFLDLFGDPVRNERGWEVVNLGAVTEVQGGLQVSARRAGHGREAPYLRVANVYRERLNLSDIKSIFVSDEELSRTTLVAGDLLIVEGHGNRDEIGRCAVWDGSIRDCVHQNHLIRARVDPTRAEPEYVSAFLNSASGRRQMLRFGKTTSGLNTISTGNVMRVQLSLPPLNTQRRYGTVRSKVLAAAQVLEAGQNSTDDLFDSLAQRAFRREP